MNPNASTDVLIPAQPDHFGVRSKVIVVEHNKDILAALKGFIEGGNLLGFQANTGNVLSVLNRNVDLGAIFLPYKDEHGRSHSDLVQAIHKLRGELPIFLRVDAPNLVNNLPDELRHVVAGAYVHSDLERLKELVDTFLFNRHYPNEFVTNVKELTLSAFRAAFNNMHIEAEPPYIVKDKIIYGELFSLLPLETSWCRGYMMIQSEEESIREAIAAHKTQFNAIEPGFRHANALLGELANMIWGGFKTRYGTITADPPGRVRVEVPILINHARKFISFGTDDPQLCFKYTLTDPDQKLKPIMMYQKYIFSLDWSPENYAESNQSVNELVSSGELEEF